jgi:peptidyl-prolyl cis-trans isomerase SurA
MMTGFNMERTESFEGVVRRPRLGAGFGLSLLVGGVMLFAAGCNQQPSADVVATVNGKPIMRADMEKGYVAYSAQVAQQQQQQVQLSNEQADMGRLKVLDNLITNEIVEQRAAKMNLTATNEEVDAKLAEMKSPVTEEQFEQHMKAENLTLDDLKHDIRRSLTGNKLLNKEINSKITVTDGDVSSYYNQHKAEYNLIEPQYRLAQIQVTSVPSDQAGNLQGSKATNDVEAKKKIQAIKTRLDSGEDFGTLAMNFSERVETASSGGDMGFVTESQLHADPTIYAEITRLKPGQATAIMPLLDAQTKKVMGYSIYKLVSKEPAGQRDLSDPIVQQAIRQQLQNDRSQLLKNAYFEMLRDQAKIINYFAETLFKNATK